MAGLRLVLLGHPRPPGTNRWKNDLADAGEALGWQVTHLPGRGLHADDVVRQAKSADLFCWARTHGYQPVGDLHGMLRRIEDAGTPTVAVHMDLYWGIARREVEVGRHPFWTCQTVYTADGGPRDWAARGVNHRWLPPPLGAALHYRALPARRFLHRAVFVGGCVPGIHGGHRRGLLAWAARTWGSGFVQYGRRGAGEVWAGQLNVLYASAGLAVGDSARAPFYWSDRLIRTLGVGGLLAHPAVEGMDGQGFTDQVMIRYRWGCYDDIADRLDSMSDADRAGMRDAAFTLVGERHLWTHRLQQIAADVLGAS